MRRLTLLGLALFLVAGVVETSEGVAFTQEAISSIVESRNSLGQTVRTIINKSFSVQRVFLDEGAKEVDQEILFLQEIERRSTEGIDGGTSHVKIVALKKVGQSYRTLPVWTISNDDEEAGLVLLGDIDFYRTSTYGAFGDEQVFTYHSLKTGRVFLQCTGLAASRDTVALGQRFIAYYSLEAARKSPDLKEWQGASGKVTLFSEIGELSRVYLVGDAAMRTPVILMTRREVRLSWSTGEKLVLPIENDQFHPMEKSGRIRVDNSDKRESGSGLQ